MLERGNTRCRRYAKEEVRDSILDAADRLLVRYGYKKMTVDDLAEEAGIGKGTVYLHFQSKEDVALAVGERCYQRNREKLKAIARSSGSPTERLKRMLVGRIMLKIEDLQHIAHRIDEVFSALRTSFVTQLRTRLMEQEAHLFAEVLIEGRLQGEFAFEDAFETAMTLLWAANGLGPVNLTTQEIMEREEVRVRATRLADLLVHGIGCRSQAPQREMVSV